MIEMDLISVDQLTRILRILSELEIIYPNKAMEIYSISLAVIEDRRDLVARQTSQ